MAKDPAFLFYSQDFIVGVQTMPFEDRGKYITILCQMHQQGRMSEETIRFLVGSVSDNLRLKFRVDEKGLWYNQRLEEETEKRNHFTETRRQNGNLGGRPKKEKPIGKPNGKPTNNHKGNLMGNENEDVNENDNWIEWGKLIVDERDQYWEAMKGRKITNAEMDVFLSVATRNKWNMTTQAAFRTSLKGFNSNSIKSDHKVNPGKVQ